MSWEFPKGRHRNGRNGSNRRSLRPYDRSLGQRLPYLSQMPSGQTPTEPHRMNGRSSNGLPTREVLGVLSGPVTGYSEAEPAVSIGELGQDNSFYDVQLPETKNVSRLMGRRIRVMVIGYNDRGMVGQLVAR